MRREFCDTCRHWRKFQFDRGDCRRYLPLPIYAGNARWPETRDHEGCGEWAAEADPAANSLPTNPDARGRQRPDPIGRD